MVNWLHYRSRMQPSQWHARSPVSDMPRAPKSQHATVTATQPRTMPRAAHKSPHIILQPHENQLVQLYNNTARHYVAIKWETIRESLQGSNNHCRPAAATNVWVYTDNGNGGGPGQGFHRRQSFGGDGDDNNNPHSSSSLAKSILRAVKFGILSYIASLVWITICSQSIDQYTSTNCDRIPGADSWKVSIIIPVLNEEKCIQQTIQWLRSHLEGGGMLEIIVVDGGSTDRTIDQARKAGATRVMSALKGRGHQMNAGASAASGDILVFLHADTLPPQDLVQLVRTHAAKPRNVLLGFRPCIQGQDGRPLPFLSWHNANKTWMYPLLLQPLNYLSGLRLMFGDQVLCCRKEDFRAVGGFPTHMPIMEDAELCLKLHAAGPCAKWHHLYQGRGRVHQLMAEATTSGRRLQAWGNAWGTYVHFRIALAWYLGASGQHVKQLYERLYTDSYR